MLPIIEETLTLSAAVHDGIRQEDKEEELDQANGEVEVGPVMTVLEDLESIALEVNIAVKVLLVEGLHGDLGLATVLVLVLLLLEVEVVLDTLVGKLDLVIFAGGDGRDGEPPGSEDGQVEDEGEEDEGFQPSTNLPLAVIGNSKKDGDEGDVAERVGTRAIGRERGVGNSGGLGDGVVSRLSHSKGVYTQHRSKLTLVVVTPQSSKSSGSGSVDAGVWTKVKSCSTPEAFVGLDMLGNYKV